MKMRMIQSTLLNVTILCCCFGLLSFGRAGSTEAVTIVQDIDEAGDSDDVEGAGPWFARLMREAHDQGRVISHRSCWPRDIPYRVEFLLRHQRFRAYNRSLHFIDMLDCRGTTLESFGMLGGLDAGPSPWVWQDTTHEMPTDCELDSSVKLAFQVRKHSSKEILQTESLTVPVTWVDSVEEVLTAVHDDKLQNLVQTMLENATLRPFREDDLLWLSIPIEWPDDVALALIFEIRYDEHLLAVVEYYLREYRRDDLEFNASAASPIQWNAQAIEVPHDGLISLRAYGSPVVALRDFQRSKYWSGEVSTFLKISAR